MTTKDDFQERLIENEENKKKQKKKHGEIKKNYLRISNNQFFINFSIFLKFYIMLKWVSIVNPNPLRSSEQPPRKSNYGQCWLSIIKFNTHHKRF